ncbi:MAG: hypothetical protein REI12_09775 [Pedobacter sp.]|nr:hypothetical protein [Pedobacter sp.]
MATDSPLQLSWDIQHQDRQLAIAPVIVSTAAGLLRYELSTINQPSRRIRQAGRVELKAGEARSLTRLAIAPVNDSCPLRLTLWLPDGSEQRHDIDPCATP